MTRDELIAKLVLVRKRNDHKDGSPKLLGKAHEAADRLLLRYINDAEITKAYRECGPFWFE